MSVVSSRRLGLAVLVAVVGAAGLSSSAIARDGLPPIHESSASGAAPPPAFSGRFSGEQKLSIDARLTRLERLVDNQALMEMLSRLEDLQIEVQEMRGELEVQLHEFEGIKQRQRDLYLDIDRRILQLEQAPGGVPPVAATTPPPAGSASAGGFKSAPATTPSIATSTPPLTSAPATTIGGAQSVVATTAAPMTSEIDPLQEQSAYQQALNILREGRYDEAVVAFQSFLTRFQGSQYAGNAQYWIGEANYVSHRYPVAVEEFQKVITSYPDSSKVPDAMLKIGYTFYELKAWDQARQTLGTLVEQFPKTTAAQLADNRLHRMKLEGR